MSTRKFSIICPQVYDDKVKVIKAIRNLTNMGLKLSKDASERAGVLQTFEIDRDFVLSQYQIWYKYRHSYEVVPAVDAGDVDGSIEACFNILRDNGVIVCDTMPTLIDKLRKIGEDAVLIGETNFAYEIAQLVLFETLRLRA